MSTGTRSTVGSEEGQGSRMKTRKVNDQEGPSNRGLGLDGFRPTDRGVIRLKKFTEETPERPTLWDSL